MLLGVEIRNTSERCDLALAVLHLNFRWVWLFVLNMEYITLRGSWWLHFNPFDLRLPRRSVPGFDLEQIKAGDWIAQCHRIGCKNFATAPQDVRVTPSDTTTLLPLHRLELLPEVCSLPL